MVSTQTRPSESEANIRRKLIKKLQTPPDISPSAAYRTSLLQIDELDNSKGDGDEMKECESWTLAADEITVVKD